MFYWICESLVVSTLSASTEFSLKYHFWLRTVSNNTTALSLSETHLYTHTLTEYIVSDFRRHPRIVSKNDSDIIEKKVHFKEQGRVKE